MQKKKTYTLSRELQPTARNTRYPFVMQAPMYQRYQDIAKKKKFTKEKRRICKSD